MATEKFDKEAGMRKGQQVEAQKAVNDAMATKKQADDKLAELHKLMEERAAIDKRFDDMIGPKRAELDAKKRDQLSSGVGGINAGSRISLPSEDEAMAAARTEAEIAGLEQSRKEELAAFDKKNGRLTQGKVMGTRRFAASAQTVLDATIKASNDGMKQTAPEIAEIERKKASRRKASARRTRPARFKI